MLRVTGFLDFFHRLTGDSKNKQKFLNMDLFPSSGERENLPR
jgi:hypothetical protein